MIKICRYCSKEFELQTKHQLYCLICKKEAYRKRRRETYREYYANHPEFREWKRKWSKSHYGTDKGRTYKAKWAREHSGILKEWRKRNPEKIKKYRHKTDSINNGYTKEFSYELKSKVKRRDKYMCVICGESKKELVIHHKDKTKLNNEIDNLITVCRSCHMKIHGPTKII